MAIITLQNTTKYKTIYADPPWNERGGGQVKRGADRHYGLMKTADIMALPIQNLVEENAHLYLWVTNNFLRDGLAVCEAWGFRYITKITWVKDRFGLGQYFRGATEDCLFAVKGVLPYRTTDEGKRAQGMTVIYDTKRDHSRKPERMRRYIETVSHPPFVELFARVESDGWDVWGEEVNAATPK